MDPDVAASHDTPHAGALFWTETLKEHQQTDRSANNVEVAHRFRHGVHLQHTLC